MNAKQTKLIEQAATVEVAGDGWRKRMERWLDTLIDPPMIIDGCKVSVGDRILFKWGTKHKSNGIYGVQPYHNWIRSVPTSVTFSP